jgi:hypothetical protein
MPLGQLLVTDGSVVVIDLTEWSVGEIVAETLIGRGIAAGVRPFVLIRNEVPRQIILLFPFGSVPRSPRLAQGLQELDQIRRKLTAQPSSDVRMIAIWCVSRQDRLQAVLPHDPVKQRAWNESSLLMARGWSRALHAAGGDLSQALVYASQGARRVLRYTATGPAVGSNFHMIESMLGSFGPPAPILLLSQSLGGEVGWHGLDSIVACVEQFFLTRDREVHQ